MLVALCNFMLDEIVFNVSGKEEEEGGGIFIVKVTVMTKVNFFFENKLLNLTQVHLLPS